MRDVGSDSNQVFRLARNATPEQEAEAWFFCFAVFGGVVERFALTRAKGIDNATHDLTYSSIW
jgi:hypothetical protein